MRCGRTRDALRSPYRVGAPASDTLVGGGGKGGSRARAVWAPRAPLTAVVPGPAGVFRIFPTTLCPHFPFTTHFPPGCPSSGAACAPRQALSPLTPPSKRKRGEGVPVICGGQEERQQRRRPVEWAAVGRWGAGGGGVAGPRGWGLWGQLGCVVVGWCGGGGVIPSSSLGRPGSKRGDSVVSWCRPPRCPTLPDLRGFRWANTCKTSARDLVWRADPSPTACLMGLHCLGSRIGGGRAVRR